MSSSTPKATINALSAMPDGKASVKQWSDQITQILHALLATLPPPPSGTGAFSGWLKSCLTPACTGQAAVLKKFMPQTLFHKVQHFYGKENAAHAVGAKSTPVKRQMPLLDLTNLPPNGNLNATPSLAALFKRANKTTDDEYADTDAFSEYDDDAVSDLASEDSIDDDPVVVDKPAKSNGKTNSSANLPFITTTYTTDDNKKHFVALLLVAPHCAEVAPVVIVTDRTVTAEVPSLKYSALDGATVINAIKGYTNMSEERALEVSTGLMKAAQQIKPWRYQLTAPFQLNPNDVHTFRKPLRVGTLTSNAKHDILVIDVCEYTQQQTSTMLLLE